MEGTSIGPYRVLGDLGTGGMGKVYLAEVTAVSYTHLRAHET